MTVWMMSRWSRLRRAGFSFATLDALRVPDFAAAMRTAVTAQTPDAWADAERRFNTALTGSVEQLLRACGDERVLEAVFLSSPEAFTFLRPWIERLSDPGALTGRDRKRIYTLMLYLQRLCTKNETASFFGPTSWIRSGNRDRVFEFRSPEPALTHRVYWANWAVQRIADVVSADPRIWAALTPRATPWTVIEAERAYRIDYLRQPQAIEDVPALRAEPARELFRLCTGHRTVAELAQDLGLSGPEALRAPLEELAGQGAVEIGLMVPSGIPDPLGWLRTQLDRLPYQPRRHWTAVVGDLDAARFAFQESNGLDARVAAMGETNRRFAGLGAGPTHRGEGQIAVDRAIVYEDCHQDWGHSGLHGPVAASLRDDFSAVLELLCQLPLARLRERRHETHDWFVENFGAGADVDLATVISRSVATGLGKRLGERDEAARAGGHAPLCDLIYAHPDRAVVSRSLDWAREQNRAQPFDAWAMCSVDIHLNAIGDDAVNSGDFSWTLGEVHALHEVLAGPMANLHPDPADFSDDCAAHRRHLTEAVLCEPLLPHRGKTSVRNDVGAPEIEFSARTARNGLQRVGAEALRIRDDGDRLAMWEPRLGEIEIMVPPERWLEDEPQSIFGSFTGVRAFQMTDFIRERPVDHLPRLQIGRFTLFRETWWLDPLSTGKRRNMVFDGQRTAWEIKQRLGLPDEVFVKLEEEPKPIFVDFANPLLTDLFVRGLHATRERARITEMLPGRSELWLDHGLGGPHTSEFRIGFYRRADI